jgi:hypothetical protein
VLAAQATEVRARAADRFRDDQPEVGRDVQRSLAEHLLVGHLLTWGTGRNPVCHLVGPAVVVPLDVGHLKHVGRFKKVGCFKPERLVAQPQPADGTLAGVCLENAGPEVRVARPLRRRGESRAWPDGLQKLPVEGWLEVFAQEQPGGVVAQGGIFFEGSPDRVSRPSVDVVFEQFAP